MNGTVHHDSKLQSLQQRSLVAGGAALALCLIGAFLDSEQFLRSWLVGYLFWIGAVLGGASLLMIHHLAGGAWGFVIRRCAESAFRTIPLMLVLILPLVLGVKDLYLWAQPDVVAHDEILQHKSSYLNVPFFVGRLLLYFVIWGVLGYLLHKWSMQQDQQGYDAKLRRRFQGLSGPGLGLMGLTMTFASIDWVMSLDPHWYSTMYGFLFMVGNVLTSLALVICALAFLRDREPLASYLQTSHFHDLGNLMMAFVLLWAYISFSQYLIIWSGNLPEEITWYLDRTGPGWVAIALVLILFHFAIPFVVLLSRRTKQNVKTLVTVAGFMILMRLLDLFWIVQPSFDHGAFRVHWLDVVTPVAIGGFWLAAFAWQLKDKPLLPLNDPHMVAAAAHSEGHS